MKRIFQLGLISFILTSCASQRSGYSPTGQCFFINHTPILEAAGDIKVLGTVGTNHIETQLAISPINHFELNGDAVIYDASKNALRNFDFGCGGYFAIKNSVKLELITTYSKSFQQFSNKYSEDFFSPYSGINDFYLQSNSVSSTLNLGLANSSDNFRFIMSIKYEIADYERFHFFKELDYNFGIGTTHISKTYTTIDFNDKIIPFVYFAPTIQFSFQNGLTISNQIAYRISNRFNTDVNYYSPFQWSLGVAFKFNTSDIWKKH